MVTRAEVDRFQNCRSAEEVVINFKRVLNSQVANGVHSELKALNLPVIGDVREEFEREGHALGTKAQTFR